MWHHYLKGNFKTIAKFLKAKFVLLAPPQSRLNNECHLPLGNILKNKEERQIWIRANYSSWSQVEVTDRWVKDSPDINNFTNKISALRNSMGMSITHYHLRNKDGELHWSKNSYRIEES